MKNIFATSRTRPAHKSYVRGKALRNIRFFTSFLVSLFFAIVLFLYSEASPCLQILSAQNETPPAEQSASPPNRVEKESDKSIPSFSLKDVDKLQKRLEKLRRLEFKDEVKAGVKTKEDLRKKLIDDFNKELSEEELGKIRKALVKFGLIPNGLKLRRLMVDLLTEQVAGFYDPKVKELYVVESSLKKGPSDDFAMIERMFGIPWQNVIIIHELTHALQDQHFDLLSLPLDNTDNDDLTMALRSLVEGEATYIQYDYLFRRRGQDLALMPGVTKKMKIQGSIDTEIMTRVPAYIREGLLFPYLDGLAFVLAVKRRKGWEGVNTMYQNLPLSTEQILHPKKYFESPPDYPTMVQLPDLSKILPEEQWEELLKNVMGEFNIRILIQEFLPNLKPKKIASGWDGDQFIVLENTKTQAMILIWFTLWDTLKDTKEFFEAYVHLLTQKYPQAHIAQQAEDKVLWSTGKNLILIERKNNNVLIIETAPEKDLAVLSETIWKNTKTEELKEIKRVDRSKKAIPDGEPEENNPESIRGTDQNTLSDSISRSNAGETNEEGEKEKQ